MDLLTWLLFAASSFGLLASPGPVVIFGILVSLQSGARCIPPIILGTLIGDAFAIAVSLLGVGFVLETVPAASSMMKIIGGGVLAYLALRSLPSSVRVESTNLNERAEIPKALTLKSFSLTALHPGSYVFFAAFFPLFVSTDDPYFPQFVTLSVTFLTIAATTLAGWMLLGAQLAKSKSFKAVIPRIRLAGAGWLLVLAAFGVFVGLSELVNN